MSERSSEVPEVSKIKFYRFTNRLWLLVTLNTTKNVRIYIDLELKEVIISEHIEHKKQTWTHKNNSFMFKHLCFYPTLLSLSMP